MIIVANKQFQDLYQQLRSMIPVFLPDGTKIALASWDPAIFATLAASDDCTLYVEGPVLTNEQLAAVYSGINSWWYWDRDGDLRRVMPRISESAMSHLPLTLSQGQVDMLVEASLPDHVRYFVELNQPFLLKNIPATVTYKIFKEEMRKAKSYGLHRMADLVNYMCFSLITRESGMPAAWGAILPRLKSGEIDLDIALAELLGAGT